MSMSTPINNLPLRTQQQTDENSDINDPMVQDVLNEFKEELNSSKNNQIQQSMHFSPPQQNNYIPQQPLPPPLPHQPQHQSHLQQPPNQPLNPYFQTQSTASSYFSNKNTFKYDSSFASYFDIELLIKSLIIIIIVILIFNTTIIPTIYDKLPSYLSSSLQDYDVYVKSIFAFIVFYILAFFQYI